MKKVAIILLSILLLYSCNRYRELEDQDTGPNYIRGRIFYINDIIGDSLPKPLPLKEVLLSQKGDTSGNYIFSVNTDSDGYFLFNNIQKNKEYSINVTSVIDNIIYYGEREIKTDYSIDTLSIIAIPFQQRQNGYIYTLKDTLGGLLPNTKACIFSSFVLAKLDTCAGSSWTDNPANAFGKISHLNIPATSYIVIFRGGNDSIRLKARDTITVPTEGIIRKTVYLRKY
jgi:hypothetical protein